MTTRFTGPSLTLCHACVRKRVVKVKRSQEWAHAKGPCSADSQNQTAQKKPCHSQMLGPTSVPTGMLQAPNMLVDGVGLVGQITKSCMGHRPSKFEPVRIMSCRNWAGHCTLQSCENGASQKLHGTAWCACAWACIETSPSAVILHRCVRSTHMLSCAARHGRDGSTQAQQRGWRTGAVEAHPASRTSSKEHQHCQLRPMFRLVARAGLHPRR